LRRPESAQLNASQEDVYSLHAHFTLTFAAAETRRVVDSDAMMMMMMMMMMLVRMTVQ